MPFGEPPTQDPFESTSSVSSGDTLVSMRNQIPALSKHGDGGSSLSHSQPNVNSNGIVYSRVASSPPPHSNHRDSSEESAGPNHDNPSAFSYNGAVSTAPSHFNHRTLEESDNASRSIPIPSSEDDYSAKSSYSSISGDRLY